jgi:hypothetical protein
MSPAKRSEAFRRQVEARAGSRCEYCLLPASVAFYPHEVDHVVARKHGGDTTLGKRIFLIVPSLAPCHPERQRRVPVEMLRCAQHDMTLGCLKVSASLSKSGVRVLALQPAQGH